MKHLLSLFLVLLAIGCTELTPEEKAAQAALSYYNRLLEGYPDGLLAAKANVDELPSDYRTELVKVYRQYAEDMRTKHQGLHHVSLSENAPRRDTVQHLTYVFLLLSYNDSTREEIIVPMVERNGEWLLK
jgi:hypothetical protein